MSLITTDKNRVGQNALEVPFRKVEINDSRVYLLTKRILDVSAAILGIILLSPVFLVVAFLIKLEDRKGPILFKQIRVGLEEKKFHMYKFRSMVSNAEELKASLMNQNEANGPVFKMKNDPRITRIGRFIRKTSIDELPQLFNVLKGDMSLVGPRPPLLEEVNLYTNYEKQRLKVIPGLTCYWQISGRSNIGFAEWMELDMKYIHERNLLIDISLIFKTVFVLFGSKDAY